MAPCGAQLCLFSLVAPGTRIRSRSRDRRRSGPGCSSTCTRGKPHVLGTWMALAHVVGMFPSHQRNPCLSAHCQYVMDRGARLSLTSAFMKQSLMSRSGCCALTATILRLSSESNSPLVSTMTPFGNTKSGV